MKVIGAILLLILFTGCNQKQNEIKIGFVAGLSGKYSSLGTSIRDGFLLAFDEIGYRIEGQKVKIIQKDDKQDPDTAKKAIHYFVHNDIKLVVGNATSSMTAVSFPIVNQQKGMLLFSPTASSSDFSAQDDNFIRLQVEASMKRYRVMLKCLLTNRYKNLFFIYDSKNASHVKGYETILQKEFIKRGGHPYVAKFDINHDYPELIRKLKSTPHDCILLVANSVDSANVIQYLRVHHIMTPIVASNWARTHDFITNGGKAVENVCFSTAYNDNAKNRDFIKFVKKFEAKYKKTPSIFAAHGYETAQIIIQNLRKSTDIAQLKDNILMQKTYQGLQGTIIFDKFGDINREYFIMKVKNAKYVRVE